MKGLRSAGFMWVSAGFCMSAILSVAQFSQARGLALKCVEQAVPVTLASIGAEVTIGGELCWRGKLTSRRTVQVAVHGATYNRAYWQNRENPWYNEYASIATLAGFVVFTIDRLGSNNSTRLPGDLITLETNAEALYGVTQALRNGGVGETVFKRVMLVGHSFGSYTASFVASDPARFPNAAEGVILTGMLHAVNVAGALSIFGTLQPLGPSELYPGDSIAGYPSYFTSLDGVEYRLLAFYHDGLNRYGFPTVDPDVAAQDEATKDTMRLGELATFGDLGVILNPSSTIEEIVAALLAGEMFSTRSLGIEVPVLLVVGELDSLYCATPSFPDAPFAADCSSAEAIAAAESAYFSEDACLEVVTVPDAGHSLNLHTNALRADLAMINWAYDHVGVNANKPPPTGCP